MAGGYLSEERPLICGMCHRRMCDITVVHGHVVLLRVSRRVGIPQKVPTGRAPRMLGGRRGEKRRDPNVRIFEDDADGQIRFRIIHEHKRNGRGLLDRTVTAATLEKLYNAAAAASEREVVLR
jgi:hypothetical protein